jgi:YVTN family beta-propeller protein
MLNDQRRQQQQDQEWNPYVGPRAFRRDPEEQKLFFGRKYESEKIISLIYSHKIVLVYAQSGAGKTSIFNANIVPALEERGLQVLPLIRVGIGSREDTKPNYTKAVVGSGAFFEVNPYVLSTLQSLITEFHDRSLLNAISLTEFLHDYFPHKVNQRGKHIPQVIIFDQLEELFNLYSDPNKWREQQQDFFKQIADALDGDPLLRVVFVIREDYLAQLDPFVSFLPEKLKPRFRLERLHKDAAYEAVKGPLERAKAYVDKKLIDKLFDEGIMDKLIEDLVKIRVETFDGRYREIRGEFVEPIQLQVVCQRLWNKLKTSQVDEINQDYFEYLGDVDKALEAFYVEAIGDTSKQTSIEEETIRNWVEKNLITSSGTRGIVHRGFKSTGGLPNNAVDILEKKYLIRKEERSGAQWYELTHDRLIKPITDSNIEWKDEHERERLKAVTEANERIRYRYSKLKILIPVIVIGAILVVFGVVYFVAPLLFPTTYQPNRHAEVISNICATHPIVQVGIDPEGVAINPTTNIVYVANTGSNTLSVIECNGTLGQPNMVEKTIPVGGAPYGLAINPVTKIVYVANRDYNTVSLIDANTNSIIKDIQVGISPIYLTVDPITNMIYVVNNGDNTVSVINGKTNSVFKTVYNVGKSPHSAAVNSKTNMLYVANTGSNTLSVIDGKTNSIVDTITVGKNPYGVAVNPNTNTIYVANHIDNSISVIDGKTNRVVKTFPTGLYPNDVAVNPNADKVYVTLYGARDISIIDGKTYALEKTLTVGRGPSELSINPNTNMVYVVNTKDNRLSVVNPATVRFMINDIQVGSHPNAVAFNPNTNMVYVSNYGDNTSSVIDAKTNVVVKTIALGKNPYGVAINNNMIYVTNNRSNTVSVIDGKTNSVAKNITAVVGPNDVAVNPNNNMVYVVSYNDTLSLIDGKTNSVAKNITVGKNPTGVAVNPNTNMVYVANSASNMTSVIDGETDTLLKTIPVGNDPIAVALNPNTNIIYVANYNDDTLSLIDGKTNVVVKTITVGKNPYGVAINRKTNTVYVANSGDNTVSVIDGKTNSEIGKLEVGNSPVAVAVNPNNNMIYVANQGEDTVSIMKGNMY